MSTFLMIVACSGGPKDTPTDGADTDADADADADTDTDADADTDTDADTDADSDADTDTGGPTGHTGLVGDPTLTVANGFGGGTFPAGTVLHVWADLDFASQIASWSGDTSLMDAPLEWNAGVVLGQRNATLTQTAVAVPLTRVVRQVDLDAGRRPIIVFEAAGAPVGGVLFFHGGTYNKEEIDDVAPHTTVMHLHRAGYTVVSVPSESERLLPVGAWNVSTNLASNGDLRNVESLVDVLRADGTLGPTTPVHAWGMSNGGQFAHTVGAVGLVDGVVAYCAAATPQAEAMTSASTAWYLAVDDQTFPTAAADAAATEPVLQGKGATTDLYVHPQTPPHPQRFQRIPGIDAATSAAIAQDLVTTGAVDADGNWLVHGSSVHLSSQVLQPLTPDQRTAVQAEIEIMAADHELYDDVSARMVAFLDSL